MTYTFRPMTGADAHSIVAWRYTGPDAFYNLDPEDAAALLDPASPYVAVLDAAGSLVGFFGFGTGGQVSGGHRANLYDDEALDVGLGLRPDLTGCGLGRDFVTAGLAYADERFTPRAFRLTVAAFNRRAITLYKRLGFQEGPAFTSSVRGVETPFLLMTRGGLLRTNRGDPT
ncbi:MAG: GNAT family N-acetyltransferase [Chloroflexota bacterium]|nr:GNAT family N-acetyltransferase [Chloroflexota bacterium]